MDGRLSSLNREALSSGDADAAYRAYLEFLRSHNKQPFVVNFENSKRKIKDHITLDVKTEFGTIYATFGVVYEKSKLINSEEFIAKTGKISDFSFGIVRLKNFKDDIQFPHVLPEFNDIDGWEPEQDVKFLFCFDYTNNRTKKFYYNVGPGIMMFFDLEGKEIGRKNYENFIDRVRKTIENILKDIVNEEKFKSAFVYLNTLVLMRFHEDAIRLLKEAIKDHQEKIGLTYLDLLKDPSGF